MSVARRLSPTPLQMADAAVRDILRSQWGGVAALRIDSPPGAGKTGIVERVAVQAMALMGQRCMVVTQTNEQAFDLVRRMSGRFTSLPFVLFSGSSVVIPEDLDGIANLSVTRKEKNLPAGPCVVVANAEKWSWWTDRAEPFDLQVIDEAYQLPDVRFHQIAGLAQRYVLVGDPGQIAPVVTVDTRDWRHDPAGPHVSSPVALDARHPATTLVRLPISRRLVPDTVDILQPIFYPRLPFKAVSVRGERGIGTVSPGSGPLDKAIDMAANGASLLQLELPGIGTGEDDEGVADAIAELVQRIFRRRTWVRLGAGSGRARPLGPAEVGVVCAHVSQVGAVRERLALAYPQILVETADRYQGLERPLMIAWHPLSGQTDAGEFHLNRGRMCVALSRHSVACFVVSRGGIEEMLLDLALEGTRTLGVASDQEYQGWKAHVDFQAMLVGIDRILR